MKKGMTVRIKFLSIVGVLVVLGILAVSFLGGFGFVSNIFEVISEKAYVTGNLGKDGVFEPDTSGIGYCDVDNECPVCMVCDNNPYVCGGECVIAPYGTEDLPGCPMAQPYCNGDGYGVSACVSCVNGGQCADGQSCNSAGQCTCDDDDDCNLYDKICDVPTGVCVACDDDDSDCVGNLDGDYCDSIHNACVKCNSEHPCTGEGETCDQQYGSNTFGTCIKCNDNGDCTEEGYGYCDNVDTGDCVRCVLDTNCNDDNDNPFCGIGIIYQDPDVGISFGWCEKDNECVECRSNCNCPGGGDYDGGEDTEEDDIYEGACNNCECVECLEDYDCDHGYDCMTPTDSEEGCDFEEHAYECVDCGKDSECEADIRFRDPECKKPTKVIPFCYDCGCVECTDSGDCYDNAYGFDPEIPPYWYLLVPSPFLICDESRGKCVECEIDDDCEEDPDGDICSSGTGYGLPCQEDLCAECDSDDDCANRGVLNRICWNGQCEQCRTDDDCTDYDPPWYCWAQLDGQCHFIPQP